MYLNLISRNACEILATLRREFTLLDCNLKKKHSSRARSHALAHARANLMF
jgi:hypothetical protein